MKEEPCFYKIFGSNAHSTTDLRLTCSTPPSIIRFISELRDVYDNYRYIAIRELDSISSVYNGTWVTLRRCNTGTHVLFELYSTTRFSEHFTLDELCMVTEEGLMMFLKARGIIA